MSDQAAEGRRARTVSGLALFVFAAFAAAPLLELARFGLLEQARGRGLAELAAGVFSARNLASLRFTLSEAACSTLAAFAVGLPGAFFVARYRFPGRRALKAAAAFPFGVPPVLVVLAFVLFYGQNGHLNRFLMAALGLREPPLSFLYSFWGIVLVHGFYEFPVVLETVGEALSLLPREREEAARLLGAGRLRAFATGTLPSLLPALAQAAGLTFLLCYFSFAVVMVFGGLSGSTLEVEVYRRARLEADAGGAALLSLVETAIALAVVFLLGLMEKKSVTARKAGSRPSRSVPRGQCLVLLIAYGLFLAVFFLGPLLSLLVEAFTVRRGLIGAAHFGFGNFTRLFAAGDSVFMAALADTLRTAIPAALLAGGLGALLALGLRPRGSAAKALVSLPLAISSIVASLGWSLLFPQGGLPLIVLVEASSALPFAAKSVLASLSTLDRKPIEAARSLGANRLRAALSVELPAIGPALAAALAFSFASAAGDVNVPLLLGPEDFQPLPLLLYRLTSSYRLPEACAVGVLLGLLVSLAFFAKELPQKDA
jgi:thiamine transport system permease protein